MSSISLAGIRSQPEGLVRSQHACQRSNCCGERICVSGKSVTEVFIRFSPALRDSTHSDFGAQVDDYYRCLQAMLKEAGVRPEQVVYERVFFEDLFRDADRFADVRAAAYRKLELAPGDFPGLSMLLQPPCRNHQRIESQVYAVVPHEGAAFRLQTELDPGNGATVKLLEYDGVRHLYVTNVRGWHADGNLSAEFTSQSDTMFQHCQRIVAGYGIDFRKVLRTWCYLSNMEATYDDFNRSRNRFFQQQQVSRLPASTGIECGLWPAAAQCGIDLYAILNPETVQVNVMQTPTLNEAADYGSSFSRGMRVDLPDRTVLFVSGTASIDENGATVHQEDCARQIDRMLLNIQQLLQAQGASFADIVQGMSYLKSRNDYPLYAESLDKWQLKGVPNTIVEAAVCRPDLLCEMEAIAIINR